MFRATHLIVYAVSRFAAKKKPSYTSLFRKPLSQELIFNHDRRENNIINFR